MTLLILGISIIALIAGIIIYYKNPDVGSYSDSGEALGFVVGVIGAVTAIVSVIAVIALAVDVSTLKIIDNKIAMYQEENTRIEEQVASVVENYQKYESDIFEKVSPESAVTLVSLYPELKSDTLVQSQIEIYTANNEKIKELKEQKLEGDLMRWWLYFGG